MNFVRKVGTQATAQFLLEYAIQYWTSLLPWRLTQLVMLAWQAEQRCELTHTYENSTGRKSSIWTNTRIDNCS